MNDLRTWGQNMFTHSHTRSLYFSVTQTMGLSVILSLCFDAYLFKTLGFSISLSLSYTYSFCYDFSLSLPPPLSSIRQFYLYRIISIAIVRTFSSSSFLHPPSSFVSELYPASYIALVKNGFSEARPLFIFWTLDTIADISSVSFLIFFHQLFFFLPSSALTCHLFPALIWFSRSFSVTHLSSFSLQVSYSFHFWSILCFMYFFLRFFQYMFCSLFGFLLGLMSIWSL